MSLFTNYAENQLVDMTRGTAPTLPVTWYIGFGSAADDGSFTELTGANLARKSIGRSLAAWSGTQGAGTTTASSGTTHQTSNNADIQFGAAAANLAATATFVGLFDAASGGNCWAYAPVPGGPLTVLLGDTPRILAGALVWIVGDGNGCSDYLSNKLVDLIFRGQAFSWPATTYEALFTAAPSNAGGGTEVAGTGYARVAVASDTTHWSGTQSAGSTAASSGTSGRTSNNLAITYPSPGGSWGLATAYGYYDASSGGNLLGWNTFATARTIAAGAAAPSFAAGQRGRNFL